MVQKTEPVLTDFTWNTGREGGVTQASGAEQLETGDNNLMQVVLKKKVESSCRWFLADIWKHLEARGCRSSGTCWSCDHC